MAEGGRLASSVGRDDVVQLLAAARTIATRVDVELFAVEQWTFAVLGFGDIIRRPCRDITDLDRVRATLAPLQQALEAVQRMAAGDLADEPLRHAGDEVGRLLQAMGEMKHSLARVVGDLRLRARAVADSISALSGAVGPSRQRVRDAEAMADEAPQVAVSGGAAVGRAVVRMDEILAASRRIADIIMVDTVGQFRLAAG